VWLCGLPELLEGAGAAFQRAVQSSSRWGKGKNDIPDEADEDRVPDETEEAADEDGDAAEETEDEGGGAGLVEAEAGVDEAWRRCRGPANAGTAKVNMRAAALNFISIRIVNFERFQRNYVVEGE
jgi:hypothetical protein